MGYSAVFRSAVPFYQRRVVSAVTSSSSLPWKGFAIQKDLRVFADVTVKMEGLQRFRSKPFAQSFRASSVFLSAVRAV